MGKQNVVRAYQRLAKLVVLVFFCVPTYGVSPQSHSRTDHAVQKSCEKNCFLLGVESVTPAELYRAAGKKYSAQKGAKKNRLAVGLVTNQTGKDQQGNRTIDILLAKGVQLRRIFVPEHGLSGTIKAEREVADTVDKKTGIPVISMFGNGSGKTLDAAHLGDLDLLVFDLQDSGMRHYTYISTLFLVMQAAAQHTTPLVVLDRPNPLKHPMEGPLVDSDLRSFISIASIPVRHGMTMGELAHYFNAQVLASPATLHVVIMKNYNRLQGLPGPLPAQLSPYITSKKACYGYSFLGLLGEVKPFDMGLGTEHAMQCVALPESVHVSNLFWPELATRLKKLGLQTQPLSYYSVRKKMPCSGLRFILSDPARFSSCQVLLTILSYVHKTSVPLKFSALFDKAAGTPKMREYVQGDVAHAALAHQVNTQLRHFYESAKSSFLYVPAPKLVLLADKES